MQTIFAIDAALNGRGMREYFRGIADARRYSELKEQGPEWVATLASGAAPLIVAPVSDDYLAGLRAGGCLVAHSASIAA